MKVSYPPVRRALPTELSRGQHQLLDALPDACAVVDPRGTVFSINAAWKRFALENGGDPTAYLGRNYFTICDGAMGESRALSSLVAKGLREILQASPGFACEYPCHSPTQKRWFEVMISPLDIDGHRCALLLHRNITSRKLHQLELDEFKRHANELAALVATSTDAIIGFDLEGNVVTWNAAAKALYGYSREEMLGRSIETLFPPNAPKRISEYIDEILVEKLQHFEVVWQTKSGQLRNIAISAAPVREADGEVTAISNIHRDVTEQKRVLGHQAVIMRELSHRTRNLLAVILAIERQISKKATSVASFHERFEARIKALLGSNDLLTASGWGPVSLRDLVQRQLFAFSEVDPGKVSIEGQQILLQPEAVQYLGMSFHELATNALKYGALAQAGGRLRIRWQTAEGNGQERRLRIDWVEAGIATGSPLEGKGFGYVVLTKLCKESLNAAVDYKLAAPDLSWSIEIPDAFFSLPE
jgi:PAS domain S-box-containing protein